MKMEIINCNEIINCYDKVLMDCIGSIPFHWNVIVIVHPIQFNSIVNENVMRNSLCHHIIKMF